MTTRGINKLTALQVKKAKANPDKMYKLPDGGNLYLRIDSNGSKCWIFNYTRPYIAKRNDLSLGTYPEVTLEEARTVRDDYKKLIKQGIDPATVRLETKNQKQKEAEHTFRVVSAEWLKKRELEGKQDEETLRRLNHDAYPYIGDMSFPQITVDVLEAKVFQRIIDREALSVAKRLKSDLNQIFKSARKKKLIQYNPIEDIELPNPQGGNFAAVTEEQDRLELDQPLWDYKYLESKYAKEGYSGEALNRKIISDSSDKKLLDDAMTLRHFDGIDDDLLFQLAQDMETNGSREMRSTVEDGGCFPAGTRIHTDKGLVPIQDIKVGDMVLSKPESGVGELCYKPVLRTVTYENKEIWDLWYFEIKASTDISKLHKGKLLQLSRKGKLSATIATGNHPFWVKGLGWTRLDQLEQGQIIETYDPETVALVLMVNPLRKTTLSNVAGSYHVRNILDAERKGFDIEDVEYFDLFEYDERGLCGVLGSDAPSPFIVNNQKVHVLTEAFSQKVYNFEVADHHTYFITNRGLWVHNTNCAEGTPDTAPKKLVTRSGNDVPSKDSLGRDLKTYTNKASVYEAFNGIQNGEGGIAIVKRAIGNDTGKNGNVLPSIEFDRGARLCCIKSLKTEFF